MEGGKMYKVACLNKTKANGSENTALGLLLWPLLCCQPRQGNAAFLVSLRLWIWENWKGTMAQEPLSCKSWCTSLSACLWLRYNLKVLHAPCFFSRLSRNSFNINRALWFRAEESGYFEAAEQCWFYSPVFHH